MMLLLVILGFISNAMAVNEYAKDCQSKKLLNCTIRNDSTNCEIYFRTHIDNRNSVFVPPEASEKLIRYGIIFKKGNEIGSGTCFTLQDSLLGKPSYLVEYKNCTIYPETATDAHNKNSSEIPCDCILCNFLSNETVETTSTLRLETTTRIEVKKKVDNIPIFITDPKPARRELKIKIIYPYKLSDDKNICYIWLHELGMSSICNKGIRKNKNIRVFKNEVHVQNNMVCETTFENLTAGNYCIDAGVAWDVDYFTIITLAEYDEKILSTEVNHEKHPAVESIWIILPVVTVTLLALFLIYFLKYRKRYISELGERLGRRPSVGESPSEISIKELQQLKVFLIYHIDNDEFKMAVEMFATILKKYFACSEVLHLDDAGLEHMLKNRDSYIQTGCKECDKIIIIHSEGAYWQFMNFKTKQVNENMLANKIFIDCLNVLAHDPNKLHNYEGVINLRFSFTKENFIVRKIAYLTDLEIPKQMSDLFHYLHRLSPSEETPYLDYMFKDKLYCNFVKKVQNMGGMYETKLDFGKNNL